MGRNQIRKRAGVSKAKACGKKTPFSTRAAAQAAADEFMEKQPWLGEKVAYPCPYSRDHFHFGAPLGRQ